MNSEEKAAFTEPNTPIAEEMQRLHELFLTMVDSGFTEPQALKLLAEIITNQRKPEGGES